MDQEKKWIRRIQKSSGSPDADKLIANYYKEIFAFSYKQTLDKELSLDLTQEIFISALQSIRSFDERKASFRTWLYKIASNRLTDYYRSKSYRYAQMEQSIEDYEFEDESDMALTMEFKEDYARINDCINELDTRSQQILRLKLFGEYTLKEIAEMESIPLSTVKTRYYSAIKWIRTSMKEGRYE